MSKSSKVQVCVPDATAFQKSASRDDARPGSPFSAFTAAVGLLILEGGACEVEASPALLQGDSMVASSIGSCREDRAEDALFFPPIQ